jgi:sugar phosphate permease
VTGGGAGPAAEARLRRWRWAIWLAFSAVYFWSYFHRVAPAVVAGDLMAAFRTTGAELGLLTAVYPWVFAVMALPAGTLADTLGPRWTIAGGAAVMGAGALALAAAPTFGAALGARLLVGLGASVLLVAFLRLCAEWFPPDRFATLTGLSQTVGNVGALAAAGPLALLVERAGWRASFALIGGATVALAAAWAGVARDRPADRGLPPVNPGRPRRLPAAEALRGAGRVVANPRSWPPALAAAGMYGTLLAFLGLWAIPYLTQVYGLTRLQATAYTSATALGVIAGSPLVGWLSDRRLRRRRLPFAGALGLYALAWAGLALPAPGTLGRPALLGLCFALGLGSGAVALLFACVREVNDPRDTGAAIGFPNGVAFLGIAVVQWALGALLDRGWAGAMVAGARVYPPAAYRQALLACLAVAAAAFLAGCATAETGPAPARGDRAAPPR